MRTPCTAKRSSPHWLQPEKARVQQQRPNAAKIKKEIKQKNPQSTGHCCLFRAGQVGTMLPEQSCFWRRGWTPPAVGRRLRAEDGWRKQHVDRDEYLIFVFFTCRQPWGMFPSEIQGLHNTAELSISFWRGTMVTLPGEESQAEPDGPGRGWARVGG